MYSRVCGRVYMCSVCIYHSPAPLPALACHVSDVAVVDDVTWTADVDHSIREERPVFPLSHPGKYVAPDHRALRTAEVRALAIGLEGVRVPFVPVSVPGNGAGGQDNFEKVSIVMRGAVAIMSSNLDCRVG